MHSYAPELSPIFCEITLPSRKVFIELRVRVQRIGANVFVSEREDVSSPRNRALLLCQFLYTAIDLRAIYSGIVVESER